MSETALGTTWRSGGDCGFLVWAPRARQVLVELDGVGLSSLFRRFPVSLLVSGPPAGESASSRPALADSDPTSPELEREDP